MADRVRLEHVSIVLCQPRFPENIGSAARAMRNLGLQKLVLVAPENPDRERILTLATHAAATVVDAMRICGSLPEALAPFQYVVGTTARLGGQRRSLTTPAEMARRLISVSRENQIAVLFGPEDRGLTNKDIRLCHALVNIPTAEFSSLNLAQAVMILCYEIFLAARETGPEFAPRLASVHDLEGMYAQLKAVLLKIGFIQPDNPEYWLNNLRQFFARLPLQAREVKIIRGLCRQVEWYAEKRFADGLGERAGGPSPQAHGPRKPNP